MNHDYTALSAAEVGRRVRKGELSAISITEQMLLEIKHQNPRYNIFTTVTADRAMQEAARVDALVKAGDDPGDLAGVPFSAKNLFDLTGEVTVAGSLINKGYPPAGRDATVVQRMCGQGAICIGATNMGEYAYDFMTDNYHYGSTLNPLDTQRSAGGSSGGSAASVLAGLSKLSLGSDTNGSVRVPASFCGLWGLKPTYGAVSRTGTFLFAGSLDTVGFFARHTEDLALAFDVTTGADPGDPVCHSKAPAKSRQELEQGGQEVRVGLLRGYFSCLSEPAITRAVDCVANALSADDSVDLPNAALARAAAYLITASEGGHLHKSRLAERAADFDPGTRDRFIAGALLPYAWYAQAQRFRVLWQQQLKTLLSTYDVLIAPATPLLAPRLDQQMFMHGDEELSLRPNIGLFTQPITLVGLPVVAAPVLQPGVLPTAVQLIGSPGSENTLLRVARQLEKGGVCEAALVEAAQVQPA